jgi:HK97 family phage prohead protease
MREFRDLVRGGELPPETLNALRSESYLVKGAQTEPITKGDGGRQRTFVISSAAVDRDGDVITPSGWRTEAWKKNPQVLWMHDTRVPAPAKGVRIYVEDGKLKSVAEFLPEGVNPFADMLLAMVDNGFLNASSVGFTPIRWEFVEDDEERRFGVNFLEQELLEWSLVTVPSNPEALVERDGASFECFAKAKAGGVDLKPLCDWAERTLDLSKSGDIESVLPVEYVEGIWKAAKPDVETVNLASDTDGNPNTGTATNDGSAVQSPSVFAPYGGGAPVARSDADFSQVEAKSADSETPWWLEHHNSDGTVYLRGVHLAMKSLLGGDHLDESLSEDQRKSAYEHLVAHLELDFDREPGGEGFPELRHVQARVLASFPDVWTFDVKTGILSAMTRRERKMKTLKDIGAKLAKLVSQTVESGAEFDRVDAERLKQAEALLKALGTEPEETAQEPAPDPEPAGSEPEPDEPDSAGDEDDDIDIDGVETEEELRSLIDQLM